MKISYRDIFEGHKALSKLVKHPLPYKTSYWVGRYCDRLNRIVKDIEVLRMDLVKKWGTKNEQGMTVEDDKLPDFTKEFELMLDTEVEVDVRKIAFETLGNIQLSGEEAVALSFLIEEPVS